MTLSTILNNQDIIPVWIENNNTFTCIDQKTGNILKTVNKQILPDGNMPKAFTPYPAILTKESIFFDSIPDYIVANSIASQSSKNYTLKANTPIFVGMKPSGEFFMAISERRTSVIGAPITPEQFVFI